MKNFLNLLLIGLLITSFTACDEEGLLQTTPTEEDMQPVSDNTNAEKGMMSAASYMNPYGLDEELSTKGLLEGTPAYTYNVSTFTLTIDFTAVEGMGGVIVIDYDSDPLADPLESISATAVLNDFEEDGAVYNGTLNFSMTVTNEISMTVETADETSISITKGAMQSTWSGFRTMVWLDGFETPVDELDDVYEITGQATGISSTATQYSSDIITPMVLSPGCSYVMYGKQEILNKVGTNSETSLTMTFHIDADGNELAEPTCNSYFKLHYVSGIMNVTLIMDMDEF